MPPLLSGDFAYVEAGLALLPPGVLEIDEEAVSDAKNFHVVPQLLLFGRPELPAHGFQFHDHLLAAAADHYGAVVLFGEAGTERALWRSCDFLKLELGGSARHLYSLR